MAGDMPRYGARRPTTPLLLDHHEPVRKRHYLSLNSAQPSRWFQDNQSTAPTVAPAAPMAVAQP